MNRGDREAYQERYRKRLAIYGHDPRTLGWTKGKQSYRFEALTSVCSLDAITSILDVGCGFGDLFKFLRDRGYRGDYLGVDFVEEVIETGSKAYPKADLRVGDFSEMTFDRAFDLVLASGIFNAKLKSVNQWSYVTDVLRQMFALSSVGCAADFLSAYSDKTHQRDDLFYASPEKAFAFAQTMTRRVALLHDYIPFEFAVHLFKHDRITEGTLFHPTPHARGGR